MIIVRRAMEGKVLDAIRDSRYTFSFGDYYDPKQMGFAHMKVIHEVSPLTASFRHAPIFSLELSTRFAGSDHDSRKAD